MEEWIRTYGYWAVLAGTFLEGETVLVLAGFAAHRGYLAFGPVLLAAFAGSLIGDQLFFFLGHFAGRRILARRPGWAAKAERVGELVRRHRLKAILGFRFLYGLRIAAPLAMGAGGVPMRLFIPLNAAGAALWSLCIGVLGYLFGAALEVLLADLRRYEMVVMAGILALGALFWFVKKMRGRLEKGKGEAGR